MIKQALLNTWFERGSISPERFFLLAFIYHLNFSGDAVLSGDAFSARFASFRAGVCGASAAWAIAL